MSDQSKHNRSNTAAKSKDARAKENVTAINAVNMQPDTGIENTSKPSFAVYAIPNLLTTFGLFAGIYAIMQSRLGHFEAACVAIYVAMIMDILDGRLARLTNTMTDFGSQYDSLADMVSFGVAPALVIYEWSTQGMGKTGSLVTFVYIACAALRLARFNVTKTSDKRYFTGLASPAAAGLVISATYVGFDYKVSAEAMGPLMCALVFFSGILMVSNIQYRSFKDFGVKDKVPFLGLIVVVLIMAAVYFDPPVAFLIIGLSYFFSGLIEYVWHNWRSVVK